MTYRFYNLTVASALDLPELAPGRSVPELRVRLGRGRQWVGGRWRWFRVWRGPGGDPWLKTGKDESRYLLRFPRQADFLIEPDGVTTTCYPRRGLSRATLRHLLLDHVLPLVVSHRGRIILHASAVATPYGGVGFLAATGAGKSTLAASLSRRGWPLVADDSLQVEPGVDSVVATASYSGLRLWAESFPALRVAPTGGGSSVRRPPKTTSRSGDARLPVPKATGQRVPAVRAGVPATAWRRRHDRPVVAPGRSDRARTACLHARYR